MGNVEKVLVQKKILIEKENTVNWRCAYLQQKLCKKVSQPSTW